MRNDDHYPKPNNGMKAIDKSFAIVVQQCRAQGRSYFGDMVRSELGTYLQNGYTPEAAAEALMNRAPRRR